MKGARVRPYRAEDRAACHGVFYRAVHEGAAEFYDAAQRSAWAPDPEPDPQAPDKLLAQWCWVAEDARGQILGFMSLCPNGYLDMAFVLPEVRGKGVAGALYDALTLRARAEGLSRLTVHASHLARRFLAKHGWRTDYAEFHPAAGQRLERFGMSLVLTEEVSA